MKKRAVHTSKDYGEFRNFVSVSQLKPTSGRDVSNLFSGASGSIASSSGSNAKSKKIQGGQATMGGFDDIIQRRKNASNPSTSMNFKSLSFGKTEKSRGKGSTYTTKTSREAYDFLREWKQHCTTPKDTLSFLTRIEDTNDQLILQPDAICKEYFSTDIDSDILGDIVEALHLLVCMNKNHDPPSAIPNENGSASNNITESTDKCPEALGMAELSSSEANVLSFTHSWLKALTSCGRFGLSISFLIPDQQLKLKEIFSLLQKSDGGEGSIDELLLHYNT